MYRRKFFFGKHKGEFILDVIESDTQYISWCLKYVEFLKFNDIELQAYRNKMQSETANIDQVSAKVQECMTSNHYTR